MKEVITKTSMYYIARPHLKTKQAQVNNDTKEKKKKPH